MKRILVPLLVTVLLVSACGAGDESSGSAAPEPDATEPAAASEEVVAVEESAVQESGEPKTLEDYLGTAVGVVRGGGGGQGPGRAAGIDEDQALEEQRLVQQEIQRCMQAQGFEYVPEQVGDGLRFFLATQTESVSPLEYAQTEGFGISTRFDALIEGDVDLTEDSSPNDDHVATLSEGEADAWQLALRGEPPVRNDQGQIIDPETGEVIQGQRGRGRQATSGCAFEAQQEVRGDFAQLAELAQDFAELDERIAADPRIAEIAVSWQDCMRVEGHDYQEESEARQAINQQFRPLLRSFFQGQGQQGQQGQGGGNALAAIAGLELTAEQEAELEALQDLERTLAVASVSCQGDTAAEVEEITARYESEFVEANRAALEAFAS